MEFAMNSRNGIFTLHPAHGFCGSDRYFDLWVPVDQIHGVGLSLTKDNRYMIKIACGNGVVLIVGFCSNSEHAVKVMNRIYETLGWTGDNNDI